MTGYLRKVHPGASGHTRYLHFLIARVPRALSAMAAALFAAHLSGPLMAQSWAECSNGTFLCVPGNVGIGLSNPQVTLDVNGYQYLHYGLSAGTFWGNVPITNGFALGMPSKTVTPSYGEGSIVITSNDSSNQLQGYINLVGDPAGPNRRLQIFAVEQDVAFRNITLNEYGGGNVGIGTAAPEYPLSVNGTIQAKEVLVNTGWSDYVFDAKYRLAPLSEVEGYVRANHHLPEIPSAKEIEEKGVSVGEMQSKLLAKIEELTLHMIEAEKENAELRKQILELGERVGRTERAGGGR